MFYEVFFDVVCCFQWFCSFRLGEVGDVLGLVVCTSTMIGVCVFAYLGLIGAVAMLRNRLLCW